MVLPHLDIESEMFGPRLDGWTLEENIQVSPRRQLRSGRSTIGSDTQRLAFSGFFGAGRYNIRLPAYGYYWGLGIQLTDVLPKWDIGIDARHHEKLGRDKTFPEPIDPPFSEDRTRMFFDTDGYTLSISRRF